MVMRGNIFCTGGVEGVKKLLSQSLGQQVITETEGGYYCGKLSGFILKGFDFYFLVKYGNDFVFTPQVITARFYSKGRADKPVWVFVAPRSIRRVPHE
jgi:hypothetical protein